MAIPIIYGFAANALGGSGGPTTTVINANDSGAGSLRAAMLMSTPRIIDVDPTLTGIITLASPLQCQSFQTIDLGGRITVTGFDLDIVEVEEVIIANWRHRFSKFQDVAPTNNGDCIDIRRSRRIAVVQSSFSWASEENFSAEWGKRVTDTGFELQDITLQSCIIAECLADQIPGVADHSRGANFTRGCSNVTIYQNFLISNNRRNPHCVGNNEFNPGFVPPHPIFDVRHNLMYNWGERALHALGGAYINNIGNLFVIGPSVIDPTPVVVEDTSPTMGTIVISDADIEVTFEGGPCGVIVQGQDPFPAPFVPEITDIGLAAWFARVGAMTAAGLHDSQDTTYYNQFLARTGMVGGTWRPGDAIPSPP